MLPNNSKSFSINQKFPFKFKTQAGLNKSYYSQAEMALMFINKVFSHFPNWLHLILTSKRCVEKNHFRKHLNSFKYDKLSMDKCVNVNAALISSNSQINKAMASSNSAYEMPNDEPLLSSSSHSLAKRLSTPVEICNAAHLANLRDIQVYILKRLDTDAKLKLKFSKQDSSVEMLNLLLIKSNYCLLYVEKIFDLILNGVIGSSEIKDIPVTLNGLYLFLIERLLRSLDERPDQPARKDLLYSVLGLGLAELAPFDKTSVFSKLKSRFLNLSYDFFECAFDCVAPILFSQPKSVGGDKKFTLFHSSFVDWLTDVKFCTLKYLADLSEAHFTLTNHYFGELLASKYKKSSIGQLDEAKCETGARASQTVMLWRRFKYHLFNSASTMSDAQLNYYFMLCESDYEHKILLNTLDRKLLQCKKLLRLDQELSESFGSTSRPKSEEASSFWGAKSEEDERMFDSTKMDYEAIFSMFELNQFRVEQENARVEHALFDLVTRGDLVTTRMLLRNDLRLRNIVNAMTDTYNQTALLVAVKLGNFEFVEYLIQIKPINLDHCDSSGWTALRYSAWMGLWFFCLGI